MANNESFNARIPRASRFCHSDVIEEEFKLCEEKCDVFTSKYLCHKVSTDFQDMGRNVESWKRGRIWIRVYNGFMIQTLVLRSYVKILQY